MLFIGIGVGAVLTGLFVVLYRRLGRFETRIHERFDYVNERVAATDDRTRVLDQAALTLGERINSIEHHLGGIRRDHAGTQHNFKKFFNDPDLTRAYLRKLSARLDEVAGKVDEIKEQLPAKVKETQGGGNGANGNGTETRPERNLRLVSEAYGQGRTELQSWPAEMTLALTTRCHVNPPCGICERNTRTPDDEFDISPQVLASLLPVFPHLETLYLHCGGEPTYSRYFYDVVDFVDPPTKIRFNTHGLTLTEEVSRFLVGRRNIDCISVSFDASTPETHRKLRGPGFERIVSNLIRLREIKAEAGRDKPTVILNMCITREGLGDIPGLIDIAAEVGADGVDYFHMNTGGLFNWTMSRTTAPSEEFVFDYAEQTRFDHARHDDLLEEAYHRAQGRGIGFNFVGRGFLNENLSEERRRIAERIDERRMLPPACTAPWSRVVVGERGEVRLCYFHDGSKHLIGNLLESDFHTVWNSPLAQTIRKEMHEQGMADVCKCTENVCIYRGRA